MAERIDTRRRRLLQAAGFGVLGLAAERAFPGILRGVVTAGRINPNFKADLEIELIAEPAKIPILPGRRTNVWRYRGKVLKGDPKAVIPIEGSYLGPILRFRRGQKVRISLHNRIPELHITHWHGMHVPFEADGHATFAFPPGGRYVYEFEVLNRPGTYWFHPHPDQLTGKQAYFGLAGLILVEDEEERALPLPRGEYDLPLVIQDRTFDDDNQLIYELRGAVQQFGFLGDTILVNGKPDFKMEVEGRAYRFRVLNGSNSRVYKLAWSDGEPITAIAVDGGLLERPVQRPYVMLAPGQRVEIWRDFSNAQGKEVRLESLEYQGGMPRMYDRMWRHRGNMGRSGGSSGVQLRGWMGIMQRHIPQGSRLTIARFGVTKRAKGNVELPDRLLKVVPLSLADAVNPDRPRPIAIGNRGRQFTLNGRTFEMHEALPEETYELGKVYFIQIFHQHDMPGHGAGQGQHRRGGMGGMRHGGMGMMGGGMGMGGMGMMGGGMDMVMMMHPIHLHGHPFQVLKRIPPDEPWYETVKDGFIDEGWLDTVLVMEEEEIHILKPFPDYRGLFHYHCHNLEHEDSGMMRNLKIV